MGSPATVTGAQSLKVDVWNLLWWLYRVLSRKRLQNLTSITACIHLTFVIHYFSHWCEASFGSKEEWVVRTWTTFICTLLCLGTLAEQVWVIQAKETASIVNYTFSSFRVCVSTKHWTILQWIFSLQATLLTLAWFDLVPTKEGSSRTADCYKLEATIFIPVLFRSILGLFFNFQESAFIISFALYLFVSHSMNFKSVRWAQFSFTVCIDHASFMWSRTAWPRKYTLHTSLS